MLDTFQQEFDDSLLEDFEETLREAKESERPSLEIDPIFGNILIGGYDETSFYQLSQWGEDIGLGSRAKFSRLKQGLEEQGIIDYESIPREVGRPRHRLVLGESVAGEESIDEIIATAIQDFSEES